MDICVVYFEGVLQGFEANRATVGDPEQETKKAHIELFGRFML